MLNMISFCCPLILCSLGALFSEFTGTLALFLDGMVNLSAFLFFLFFTLTKSFWLSFIITIFTSIMLTIMLSWVIETFKANKFIASIGMNLLFSALPSTFSSVIFKTRGILNSSDLQTLMSPLSSNIVSIIITSFFICCGILFLQKTRYGLYIRISAKDSDVLLSKGVNPSIPKITGWSISSLYGSLAGILLILRICAYVPNISSSRGWLGLAAVFVGKKKPLKIILCVVIFCIAEIFATYIQNFIPQIPISVLISFPYLVILCLVLFN